MSRSEPSADGRLAAIAAELRRMGEAEQVQQGAELRDVLVAATMLYGAAVRQLGHELSLAGGRMTPTDAVVLCCALLRAQDLNPFDLTLWFGRVAPDIEAGSPRP